MILRCPLCLDGIGTDPTLRCADCATALHQVCTAELQAECPTLGCDGPLQTPPRAPEIPSPITPGGYLITGALLGPVIAVGMLTHSPIAVIAGFFLSLVVAAHWGRDLDGWLGRTSLPLAVLSGVIALVLTILVVDHNGLHLGIELTGGVR